jgi:hypothetical protein
MERSGRRGVEVCRISNTLSWSAEGPVNDGFTLEKILLNVSITGPPTAGFFCVCGVCRVPTLYMYGVSTVI